VESPWYEFKLAAKLNGDCIAEEGVLTTGLAVPAGVAGATALENDGTGGSVDNCSRWPLGGWKWA
jgi:hypothetical protein